MLSIKIAWPGFFFLERQERCDRSNNLTAEVGKQQPPSLNIIFHYFTMGIFLKSSLQVKCLFPQYRLRDKCG